MMEFFLSKFWAFLVAMVIMGVLVQGVQADARDDRDVALNDLAEELEGMFNDLADAGPGLEATIDLGQVLPSGAKLTLLTGNGLLEQGGQEVRFAVPVFRMNIETEEGNHQEVGSLVLGPIDTLLLVNQEDGATITLLNR